MAVLDFWPWLGHALVLFFLVSASGLGLCWAIGTDVDARGANAVVWTPFAIVLLPIAVLAYVLYSSGFGSRPAAVRSGSFRFDSHAKARGRDDRLDPRPTARRR